MQSDIRVRRTLLYAAMASLPALVSTPAWTQQRAAPDDARYWALCSGADAIAPFPYRLDKPHDLGPDEIVVEADRMNVELERLTVFEGDVELRRQDQWLGTPRLEYRHEDDSWLADQGVRYRDGSLRFVAERAEGFPERELHRLEGARYQILARRGNGRAARAELDHGLGWLHEATFTTCDPGDRHWHLRAKKIKLNEEEGMATAWGTQVRVGNVPVFYLPYFVFPIDDRRRSGFLYPEIALSSRNGFELEVPYYFNLAPNYDATLSPRLMTDRGLMLGGEFRYLFRRHRGELEGRYLPDDADADRDRGELHYRHLTLFSPAWQASADINLVSDDRYFEDFGESSNRAATRLLSSQVALRGRGRDWRTELAFESWDLVDPLVSSDAEPFRRLPRLDFRWDRSLFGPVRGGLRSELALFEHTSLPAGDRIDLRPYLSMPMEGLSWFVRPEIGYRYTAYELDRALAINGDTGVDRGMPIYSLDSGLFFERETRLFGRGLLQTLEPRLYYLRVPFRDQDELPVFDSRELTFGFAQLFRDNAFSGGDRQINANQATLAVTTRYLDPDSGREYFSFSLGQTRLFEAPRVGLPGIPIPDRSASPVVAETDFRLDDRWSIGATHHWDPEEARTDLSVIRTQYRFKESGVANLSYRFRRGELEQADASLVYPVSPSWTLFGRWNFSLRDSDTVEGLAGLQWDSCCLAVRLLGRHFIRNREGEKSNQIYLELELKGLGNAGRDTVGLLERAILGYRR